MVNTILGKKIGMTQLFDEEGKIIPVTVISAGPCVVLGINEKNVCLGYEDLVERKVKKPQAGIFKKINVTPKRYVQEFRKGNGQTEVKIGDEVKADIFKTGDYVDVVGVSIGKGFQGGMKRWNWMGTPKTHGSTSKRRVGSIGSSADPSRVFKGTHMPGHMGNRRTTVQNLRVIRVDLQNNLLVVKGGIPGSRKGLVAIRRAKKKQNVTQN